MIPPRRKKERKREGLAGEKGGEWEGEGTCQKIIIFTHTNADACRRALVMSGPV